MPTLLLVPPGRGSDRRSTLSLRANQSSRHARQAPAGGNELPGTDRWVGSVQTSRSSGSPAGSLLRGAERLRALGSIPASSADYIVRAEGRRDASACQPPRYGRIDWPADRSAISRNSVTEYVELAGDLVVTAQPQLGLDTLLDRDDEALRASASAAARSQRHADGRRRPSPRPPAPHPAPQGRLWVIMLCTSHMAEPGLQILAAYAVFQLDPAGITCRRYPSSARPSSGPGVTLEEQTRLVHLFSERERVAQPMTCTPDGIDEWSLDTTEFACTSKQARRRRVFGLPSSTTRSSTMASIGPRTRNATRRAVAPTSRSSRPGVAVHHRRNARFALYPCKCSV